PPPERKTTPPAPPPAEQPPDEEPAASSSQKAPRRFAPLIILTGILAAIIAFTLAFLSSAGLFQSPLELAVPDVQGKPRVEAKAILGNRGLTPKITGEQASDIVPEGYVIGQHPAPGARVRSGMEVELIISTGHRRVTTPNVTGINARDAEIFLKNARLLPGEKTAEYSDDFAERYVISQDPPAGTELTIGSRVNLVISRGREPRKITMRDLTGVAVEEAVEILYDMGVTDIMTVEVETGAAPGGAVVAQSVLENASADRGGRFTLYAARPAASAGLSESEGTVTLRVGDEKPQRRVVIIVIDQVSARRIYEREHAAGDDLMVPVSGIGKTRVMVYLDGFLHEEKTL
ncbi:MAG: PASTA domain-containing protein, partial [bacterium]